MKVFKSLFGCLFALVVFVIVWLSIGFVSVWALRITFGVLNFFTPHKTSVVADPVISATGLKQSDKDAFMKGCVTNSNFEYCNCVFNGYKDKATLDELVNESKRLAKGEKPSQMTIDVTQACAK